MSLQFDENVKRQTFAGKKNQNYLRNLEQKQEIFQMNNVCSFSTLFILPLKEQQVTKIEQL